MEYVLKSNEAGESLGRIERQEAHSGNGILHKAFSVFIFRNGRSEVLLQKRSSKKQLFGELWANTCCSHPKEGEEITEAGHRRLLEECGIDLPLAVIGSFIYKAEDPRGNGIEYEHDTILVGDVEEDVVPHANPEEIEELKWMALEEVQDDLVKHPEQYAPWFPLALEQIFS